MDTVSWLSFFTASGLGAALGVLSLTALGACLYLRAPGQRPAGHPGRGAGLCAGPPVWGRCPAGRTGALLAGVGPDRPVSDRGRAGCPPAGGDIRGLGALCLGKDWVTAVCVLGCAAALLGAAACAGAGLVGSGGREQVVRLAGETLVVRDGDLLHQVGWRYVNLFVHGEPLACWRVS